MRKMNREYKEMLAAYDIPPSEKSFRTQMWMVLLKVIGRSDEFFVLGRIKYVLRKLYGASKGSYMKEVGEILDKINRRRQTLREVMMTKDLLEGIHQNSPEIYPHWSEELKERMRK